MTELHCSQSLTMIGSTTASAIGGTSSCFTESTSTCCAGAAFFFDENMKKSVESQQGKPGEDEKLHIHGERCACTRISHDLDVRIGSLLFSDEIGWEVPRFIYFYQTQRGEE